MHLEPPIRPVVVTGLAPTAVDLQSLLTLLRPGGAADVGGVFVDVLHGSHARFSAQVASQKRRAGQPLIRRV